jgi:hypothetical protein
VRRPGRGRPRLRPVLAGKSIRSAIPGDPRWRGRLSPPARAANRADVVPPPGTLRQGGHRLVPGVALRYAGEIAVNHCAPDAQQSELLDAFSTSQEPLSRYAHIHCWHTDDKFSKHHFMSGRYTPEDAQDLDLQVVRDYCMAMSFRSLGDLEALQRVEDKPRRDVVEQAQHQPEERAPLAASVAVRISSDAGVSSRSARAGLGPEVSLPLVSCICPTYNRPPHYQHLLEEAIASFCDRAISE